MCYPELLALAYHQHCELLLLDGTHLYGVAPSSGQERI